MAMGPGYLYSLPSDVLKRHLKADSQLGTEVCACEGWYEDGMRVAEMESGLRGDALR